MKQRIEKINELIKREMSQIIVREIEAPDGSLITITRVETSEDLSDAKILISIFPFSHSKKVLFILLKRIGEIQGFLNRRLAMRPLPRIRFVIDETEEKASQIEHVLNKIKKESPME
ncbi:MAG: 30S ribosome-binding factor RbfA [Patescibacteria group bacterium]|jgi:ribosome-binding factor A